MIKAKILIRALAASAVLSGVLFMFSCASATKPSAKNLELVPSANHGTVLLVRIADKGEQAEFDVVIDGVKVDTIGRDQRMKVTVPNGNHTIHIEVKYGKTTRKSEELIFFANSDETFFHIFMDSRFFIDRFYGYGDVVLIGWPK
jgi:hypothetical protein